MSRWLSKSVIFGLLLLLVISLPTGSKRESKNAQAASLTAYAGNCLGGWDNPNNAAGPPIVLSPTGLYDLSNSAVLNQKVAQIFCGYFESEDKSYQPSKVTLKFSWHMDFSNQSSSTQDADALDWSDVISSTTATSSNPLPPEAPQASSTEASSTEAAQPSSTAPMASSTEQVPPAESSSSTPPTPPRTPAASLLNLFVRKVFAQSSDNQPNFLEITYSVDGMSWNVLGYVNQSNWENFSADIPVSSWDDIDKIQIQLAPITSLDMPAIYLDSMYLQIDYDHSIIDSLKEGTDAVLNATSDAGNAVSDAINNVADSIQNAVDNVLQPQEPEATPQTPESEVKIPKFSFALKNSLPTVTGDLPWYQTNARKHRGAVGGSANVAASNDQNSFKVESACGDFYYTVIIFRNSDDYIKDPASAVFNRAYPCENGTFSQTFSAQDFPNLPDGTYYLLTADQGAQGPWTPNAPIREITIIRQNQ
jgi:hypothetical protein